MKNFKLLAVLVLLPLLLALYGGWQWQRSLSSAQETADYQAYLKDTRPQIAALQSKPGAHWVEMDGQKLGVELALSRIDQIAAEMDTLHAIDRTRHVWAITTVSLSLLAAFIGFCGMLGVSRAAARALRSRQQLLQTFTRVSKAMPFVLVGHVLTMGVAVVAVLGFEGLCVWHAGKMSAGEFKLMIVAAIIMCGCLYSLWQVARQLRVMLHLFEPTPLSVVGRAVTPEQAPGLWHFVEELAGRLEALPPEHIVLGMTEGFYVTSSDIELLPANAALSGRTLHIPVTYLGLLDSAELSAVIGHELGHFAGEDTEYSLRFLPIHDGIGRSLHVLLGAILQSDLLQRSILRPALMLGVYFMECFDHSVSHWSRVRELAADAAGARVGGNLASASALVRISAIDPLVMEELSVRIRQAIEPQDPPLRSSNLPLSLIQGLIDKPLVLPPEELAVQLPHPSDTHPSNGERIAALQVTGDEAVSRGVRPVDVLQAEQALQQYFADSQATCAAVGEDFLGLCVAQDAEVMEQLRQDAEHVSGEVILHEGGHVRGWITTTFFGLLGLAGLVAIALPWILPAEKVWDAKEVLIILGCILLGVTAMLLPASLRLIRRADEAALVLTPDHLLFSNLKEPLPIRDIADFNVHLLPGSRVEFLIEDNAPLPVETSRGFFRAGARVISKQRVVQLTLVQFCRDNKALKPQELAELIALYLNAGNARHVLQQRSRLAEDGVTGASAN